MKKVAMTTLAALMFACTSPSTEKSTTAVDSTTVTTSTVATKDTLSIKKDSVALVKKDTLRK